MSNLTAVRIGNPNVRQSHHLYGVLRHTLATLANTTEAEMPVELIVKASELADRATDTALERWWGKVTAPNVAVWGSDRDEDKTFLLVREDC